VPSLVAYLRDSRVVSPRIQRDSPLVSLVAYLHLNQVACRLGSRVLNRV
jgi:hypothetical protein